MPDYEIPPWLRPTPSVPLGAMGGGFPAAISGNPVPGAPPPAGPPTVPQAGEVQPGTESSRDHAERATAEDGFERDITPQYNGPPRIGPTVMPGYEDFSGLGGPEGHDIYNEALIAAPQRYGEAAANEADIVADRGSQLKEHYTGQQNRQSQELAAMHTRRLENQANIDARQAKLDEATSRYSADLADRGKFWHNPGNVFAAFAASLMPLGSSKDPEIGLKLINQAINQDFRKRQELADMDLGALRSNLSGYRQIAGDRELGDLKAMEESTRVASMELGRISAQFQGPLAKAQAAKVQAGLDQQTALLRMKIYEASVAHKPRLENPAIAKEYRAMGAAMPGVGPTPYKGSWKPGEVSPQGSGTAPAGQSAPTGQGPQSQQAPSGNLNDTLRAATGGQPTSVDKHTKQLYEERAPGTEQLVTMYRNQIAKDAMIEATGNTGLPPTKAEFDKAVLKIQQKDREDTDKVSGKALEHVGSMKSWGKFGADLKLAEQGVAEMNAANGSNITMDQFLGDMRTGTGSYAAGIQNLRLKYGSKDTPAAKQAMEQLEASERLHHMLAEKTLDYYHSKLGGTMSEHEISLAKGVIAPNSSWAQIRDFGDQGSRQAGVMYNGILSSAGSRVATRLRIRHGTGSPKIDSPGARKSGK